MLDRILAADVYEVYMRTELSVEQKVQELKKNCTILNEYDGSLEKIFMGTLPCVTALEVVTKFQDNVRSAIEVYEQPAVMDQEVEKELAQLFAYYNGRVKEIDRFSAAYERWNDGKATETGKSTLEKYKKDNGITGIEDVHYTVVPLMNIGGAKGYQVTVLCTPGAAASIHRRMGLVIGE